MRSPCSQVAAILMLLFGVSPASSQLLSSQAKGSARAQVVMLSVNGGCAAGIIVGYDEKAVYIATAAHIAELSAHPFPAVAVRFEGLSKSQSVGKFWPQFEKKDQGDLAVVTVSRDDSVNKFLANLDFALLSPVPLGPADSPVTSIGCFGGAEWSSGNSETLKKPEQGYLRFESDVGEGQSGGGLYNEAWELIGMPLDVGDNGVYARPIGQILEDLGKWKVPIQLAPRQEKNRVRGADEIARENAAIAQARQLAARSESLRVQGPSFGYPAIILALESARRDPTPQADMALRRSMASWRLLSEVRVGPQVDVVAFSPDGRLLASADAKNGTIMVSDVITGEELARLQQKPFPKLPTAALVFSPNGRWLVTAGSADGAVFVWNSMTRTRVASLKAGLAPIVSLAFSPDGRWLVTGGLDGSAIIWETASWNLVFVIRHDLLGVVPGSDADVRTPEQRAAHFVTAVAFSPDGRRLATSSDDGTVALWKVGTWKSLARFRRKIALGVTVFSHDLSLLAFVEADDTKIVPVLDTSTGKQVTSIESDVRVEKAAFSPDDNRLVTGYEDGSAEVWDVHSGRSLTKTSQSNHPGLFWKISSVAFSPDGAQIVAGGEEDIARVWDSGTGQELGILPHHGFVQWVTFSADGRRMATGSWDGSARVWEPPLTPVRLQGAGRGFDIGADCQHVVGSGANDFGGLRSLWVWETATGKEIDHFEQKSWSGMDLSLSPDGRWVAGAETLEGSVRVWNLSKGSMVSQKQFASNDVPGPGIAFSPDSRWIASGGGDGTARVWETATGTDVAQVQHKKGIVAVAFSPDGRWLATASRDGTARVSEAGTGKMVALLPGDEKLDWIIFSPNSRWLVTMPDRINSKHSWLWEAATGRLVARLEHPDVGREDVYSSRPEFSPDGRWIATASGDTLAIVWETSTGKQIAELKHNSQLVSLSFDPDSRRLVTAGEDGTLTIWQIEGSKRIAEFHHASGVNSVAFSPDGRWVGTGGKDGTARVWDANTGEEIVRADQGEEVLSVAFTHNGALLAALGGTVVGLHPLRLEDTVKQACSSLSRNLSRDEWNEYVPGTAYRLTCPNLP